jgi:putative flavoprotein involved in K+ transport
MDNTNRSDVFKVIVIGAGQVGLSVGYFLSKSGIPFLILDANKRIGDSWRSRWDSLKLFTPSKFNGLAGLPFPAAANYFPTKDEMADYLEEYAVHFNLPVMTGVKVTGLSKEGNLFCIMSENKTFMAENVVIAMSTFQIPKVPGFAKKLDQDIVQFHSLDYREPSQFQNGGVLVVGAGNSGAEIAIEAAKNDHDVWLSGRDTGHLPFRIESTLSRLILIRLVVRIYFHRILTTNTPIGRKARPKLLSVGGPLIRLKPKDFADAGIERVPRVTGVTNGLPVLDNGQVLDVKNVVWCTGFYPSFSWIDIPVFKDRELMHDRGIIKKEPGLYFTGLHFLYAFSSMMIHGAARDAEYIVKNIKRRINDGKSGG